MGRTRFMKFVIGLYTWIQLGSLGNFNVIRIGDRLEGFDQNAAS